MNALLANDFILDKKERIESSLCKCISCVPIKIDNKLIIYNLINDCA